MPAPSITSRLALLASLIAVGCNNPPEREAEPRAPDAAAPIASTKPAAVVASTSAPKPTPVVEPDGNDDPEDSGSGELFERARFERVGKAPLALRRICDLTPFDGALYAAHANEPLGMDGATITRYKPDDPKPFSVAFDWNRPGEPARNGGGGQGFLRVHAIGGRLFVPDADPPYNGFGISEPGTEGFVFVSDPRGEFAPPAMPKHRPPDPPDAQGKAGAAILPRAYHVLDVIRYRGQLYASTGSVPPSERAWHGASPGALHAASADLARWEYAVDYPRPWQDGVWRLTYLVRFKGRLYAGIQDYDNRDPNDYVVFAPPEGVKTIRQEDARPARITRRGGALTLRWYADGGRLYWIAMSDEGTFLRVSEDGETWRVIALPKFAGRPTDVTRFRGVPVVLAERGLYRIDREPAALVAKITSVDGRSPFEPNDWFCAAPLAVFAGELYAGGQRDGALYRVVAER